MENPAGGTNSTCDQIGTFGVFTDKYAGSQIIIHFHTISVSTLGDISLENFNISRSRGGLLKPFWCINISGIVKKSSPKTCQSTVGRLSADCWPSVGQLSAFCWPTIGRLLVNCRPTVGPQSADKVCHKHRLSRVARSSAMSLKSQCTCLALKWQNLH